MILRPVLLPVSGGVGSPGPQRFAAQRHASRRALALCSTRCCAADQEWLQADDGRPLPSGGYHWSVSHKPQWAAAVIADRPVGIDIEHVRPRNPDLVDVVGSEEEWAWIGEPTWMGFFCLWTAKEATLKANGVGIGELQNCRLARVERNVGFVMDYCGVEWRISHHLLPKHIAAVTVSGEGVEWT